MPRSSDNTRERLIAAAKQLLHEQGMHNTSLAEIANLASVPVGNVYYHFRTKDSLISAVIDAHSQDLHTSLAQWTQIADPRERLKAFVRSKHGAVVHVIRSGCPYGSLCAEIEKSESDLALRAAEMLRIPIDWATEQFAALGCGDQSPDYAADLIASLQGTMLLSNTFRSPELLHSRLHRVEQWLDDIACVAVES